MALPAFPLLTYAICLCVKSFDTVLISLQAVVAKRCQTFHHQVDLPVCSVELKCISVHFKWPCWSLRCLVKPVKMACLPSPGSCRCRKSIICLGCNLHCYVEHQPLTQMLGTIVKIQLQSLQSESDFFADGHLQHDIMTSLLP